MISKCAKIKGKMNINKKKKITAVISIFSNIVLTILKVISGILSGSISIISEALHSLVDLFASFLTYFSVMKSSKPADCDHPYGHGKYEDVSGTIEGILIIFASIFIIYEAVRKIISGAFIESSNVSGIIVMAFAVIVNFIVSSILIKVAKESNSISLLADGEHLRTDVYSSLGVMAGLIMIKLTGYTILDPIIAILIAIFIYKTGYKISKKGFGNLLDHSLSDSDIEKIQIILNSFSSAITLKEGWIKTRQVGPYVDIDLILCFPKDTTLCECHKICDEIEKKIKNEFINCFISIHTEPVCYSKNCQNLCGKQAETIKS